MSEHDIHFSNENAACPTCPSRAGDLCDILCPTYKTFNGEELDHSCVQCTNLCCFPAQLIICLMATPCCIFNVCYEFCSIPVDCSRPQSNGNKVKISPIDTKQGIYTTQPSVTVEIIQNNTY